MAAAAPADAVVLQSDARGFPAYTMKADDDDTPNLKNMVLTFQNGAINNINALDDAVPDLLAQVVTAGKESYQVPQGVDDPQFQDTLTLRLNFAAANLQGDYNGKVARILTGLKGQTHADNPFSDAVGGAADNPMSLLDAPGLTIEVRGVAPDGSAKMQRLKMRIQDLGF